MVRGREAVPKAAMAAGALVGKEGSVLSLSQMTRSALRARLALLQAFNEVARFALPLVDLRLYEDPNNMAHLLARNKGRLFVQNKEAALVKSLDLSRESDVPHITLNRGTTSADLRKWDKTVFFQVFRALELRPHSLRSLDRRGSGKQSWVTTFEGEGGSDHGGLFRDSLREICAELQVCNSFARTHGLQLLVPCPNQRRCRGSNQDKWLPRPARRACTAGASPFSTCSAPVGPARVHIGRAARGECGHALRSGSAGRDAGEEEHFKMLKFLGALMGASVRTDSALELDFPSLVWKPLVGEMCDESDVAAVDECFASDLISIRECPSAESWSTLARGLRWRVPSITGRWIDLVPEGSRRRVLWQERHLYVEEAVRVRLSECDPEIQAIKAGFASVVPSLVLPLLTWRDLEAKVCGTPIIDIDMLKKITEHNLPGKEKHTIAVMFWKVVDEMTNMERAALLAFVSGRRRLPSNSGGGHFKIELLHGRGDEALPEAHTCFFTIDLPQYSSEHIMREKLLYAIHNCTAIDKVPPESISSMSLITHA